MKTFSNNYVEKTLNVILLEKVDRRVYQEENWVDR